MKLAPSILAADFARLGAQVAEAGEAGADRIHIEAMDGHFVPNLSMGAPIVAALRPVTRLPYGVKPWCDLEVDGGIDPETAHLCDDAGANVLAAGSAVFGNSQGVAEARSHLRARKE